MNIFDWLNNITDEGMASLNVVIIFLGVGIFVVGVMRGKGRIPSIIISLVAGGLFIWGGLAGVFWMKDQAEGTIQSAAFSTVETASVYTSEG